MNKSVCPGCGFELKTNDQALDEQYNASHACRQLYDELSAFTLSLRDKDFIHQTIVDTYAAQHSGHNVKPISTAFALIGLYLVFERGYTGKQVQQAHRILGELHRQWPRFDPPVNKNALTVAAVLHDLTEENYREQINSWAKSVWLLWSSEHENVRKMAETYLNI
jgi:hypothetical protein